MNIPNVVDYCPECEIVGRTFCQDHGSPDTYEFPGHETPAERIESIHKSGLFFQRSQITEKDIRYRVQKIGRQTFVIAFVPMAAVVILDNDCIETQKLDMIEAAKQIARRQLHRRCFKFIHDRATEARKTLSELVQTNPPLYGPWQKLRDILQGFIDPQLPKE